MGDDREVQDLEQLLDRIDEAADRREAPTFGFVLELVGRRSFGPMLLLAGVITLAPIIGDIPGVPTTIGVLVFLIGVQLLVGRSHFWLPQWVLRRSIHCHKLEKGVKWSRRPARFIDWFLRPRLQAFTNRAAAYAVAVICVGIALTMPVMEFVPFSANVAGAALTAFGLGLIAHDGLLILFAFLITLATAAMVIYNFV